MSLRAGSRLGNYEIVGELGAGGMGEVYRARDETLGREVAIKVLPDDLSQDDHALSRFQREARLLASLNHPHIATLHGLEVDGEMHYLVMELVAGDTLRDRLMRGAIEVDEALPLLKQLAEAVAAAHKEGVIHRDLKPANIKITPEGEIKVLDFGLAKALDEEAGSQELSQSPTASFGGTRDGVILGTAPYMSPEQARGKRVDKETDVWAFGCVCFEALTGNKAFSGETFTDTLAAIVRSEPDWDSVPHEVPWRARDLIRRCLRKDPKRRLKDLGDAALDIEDALDDDDVPGVRLEAASKRSTITAIVAASALLGGLVVWGVTSATRKAPAAPPDVRRFAAATGVDGRLFGFEVVAISSQSDTIALVAFDDATRRRQVYLRRLDALDATPIAGTEGGWSPFFSPDGESIGFMTSAGELRTVPLSGGSPRTICAGARAGGVWTEDGRILFGSRSGELQEVPASGGEPRTILSNSGQSATHFRAPALLPDGSVLYEAHRDYQGASIGVLPRNGESRILIENGAKPRYVETGHIIYFTAGQLHAVAFDAETLQLRGAPRPLVTGVQAWSLAYGASVFYDVSGDGNLVYVVDVGARRQLVWVDRAGASEAASERLTDYQRPRLSPDGRRVAVTIEHGDEDRARDLWILELERDTLSRLTFDPAHDLAGIWSPDGRTLAFTSSRSGTLDLFAKSSDGTGRVVPLVESESIEAATSWTPDGARLLFLRSDDNQRTFDIDFVDLEEGGKIEGLIESPFNERHASVSPDGRWLLYVSNESGRDEVFVQPFPTGDGKWQVSTEGGTEPQWSRDGREIFYRGDGGMMGVAVAEGAVFEPASPTFLFDDVYRRDHADHVPNYDVAPDGRFLMVRSEEGAANLRVVLNWAEELKRLVPVE